MNLDAGNGSGETRSGSEYSLQVNVIEYAIGLEVRYERKKEVLDIYYLHDKRWKFHRLR